MGDFDISLGKGKNAEEIDLMAMNGGIKKEEVAEEYKSIFEALDKDGRTEGLLETEEIVSFSAKVKNAIGKNRTFSKHEAKKLISELGLKGKVTVETFFNFLKNIINVSAKIDDSTTDQETGQTVIKYKDNTVQTIDAKGQLRETKGVDEEGEYTRTELGDGKYNLDRGKTEDTKVANPFEIIDDFYVHTTEQHYVMQYSNSEYYRKIYDNGSYITYDSHDRPVGGKYMRYNGIENILEEYTIEYDNDNDKAGVARVGISNYKLDAQGRVTQEYFINVDGTKAISKDYKYYPNGTAEVTNYKIGKGSIESVDLYQKNSDKCKHQISFSVAETESGTLYNSPGKGSYMKDNDGNVYTHAKSGETIQDTVRRIFGYVSEYEAMGITDDDINEFIKINQEMGNIPKGKNYFLLTTDEDQGRVFIPKTLADKLDVLSPKKLLVDKDEEWNKHNQA